MEDIKSSFDRMMDKFNESVTHSAPKKLTFEYIDDSLLSERNCKRAPIYLFPQLFKHFFFNFLVPKKRRISYRSEEDTPSGSVSINASNCSLNTSAVLAPPPSPWVTRHMKADLIEANARV